VTGVVSIVVEDAVVGGAVVGEAVVDVEHGSWVVVVPPGSDVVDPCPVTGVVAVVVLDPDGTVVVGAVVVEVDVEHTVVVVGATVVVAAGAVVVVTSVVAGATVVLDAGVVLDVGAVVDADVGTAVVGGGCVVEGGTEVLGGAVVDVVEGVLVVHCESSSTDVLCVSVKLSGHTAWTVSVIVPLTPPGTNVVAKVVPFSVTGFAYPVTGYDCALIVATAVSMAIASVVSLLPIDQCTTWTPSEHVVEPWSTGWCAHAGVANPNTVATATPATSAARPDRLRTILSTRLTASPKPYPPRLNYTSPRSIQKVRVAFVHTNTVSVGRASRLIRRQIRPPECTNCCVRGCRVHHRRCNPSTAPNPSSTSRTCV